MQVLIGCALFAAFLSLPLSAQNAHTHSSEAQANLRININVVPAIGAHHRHKDDKDKDGNREEDTVSYSLNPQHEDFSVTEELRPMLVNSGGNTVQQEQVRAITVVLK
jgi:hypothetical protein